jgi:hypothetical protein
MCKEPIQRKEERQRFHIRRVAAESAAFFSRVILFLLVAMISILAVLILPAVVLLSMCLQKNFFGQRGIARLRLGDHVPHAIIDEAP